jgi:hypothetical protein
LQFDPQAGEHLTYRSTTSASTVALDGGRAGAARHGVNSK